ncbi:hypothetical protein LNP26_27890 [Klebsiella variicola subsp. variicola]|nr:hypothetical protein [Klebsiella variicola subsp. variicola]
MSVGYFNGGGDVTAGPGGDIDKLDVRQITHLNYSFGLIYNDEKDETNAALKDPASSARDLAVAEGAGGSGKKLPALRKQNPDLGVPLSVGGRGRGFPARRQAKKPGRCLFSLAQEIVEKYGSDGIDSTGSFRSTAPGAGCQPTGRIAITLPHC